MKNKGVFLAAILTAVLCISGNVFAVLSGGGTEANPYLIQSRTDFDEFANPANSTIYWASGVYTKLMCDPNLSGTTYTQAVIAPDTNTSSGFQGTQFTGVFDGNSHTISNLTITASTQDYIGLFGYVGSSGQISNLGVKNVNITGREYVGGLVGYSNSGTLIACYATGSVSGTDTVGGLVGLYAYGTLTSCYATGLVSGGYRVGGLVGYRSSGEITSCYATGSVSGTDWYVGGLVGANSGTLTSCYATGSVSGTNDYVGGLAGYNNSGTLIACYATGSVTGTGTYIGGLVGRNISGTSTSCFWDKETSGQPTSDGGTGKTTAEMKTLSTFTGAGWDFASVWAMPLGQYPVLFLRQMGDLNSDARVDMQDFAILAANWLEGI